MPARAQCRRGVALILVLWVLTVLSAVGLELSLFTRLRTRVTRNVADNVRTLFLARAGVERAMADLKRARNEIQALDDLREGEERLYQGVELGEGSYTLVAAPAAGAGTEPEYGIADEAAKLNVNTASAEALAKLPGMDADLAAEIVALRGNDGTVADLADLCAVERLGLLGLYGEDQNGNGLLDPSEDDGDAAWPPDDQDGVLDPGLAAWLTCCSAARNLAADGRKRANINKADAATLASAVSGMTEQQAQSVVEHRKNAEFENIAGLLDVMLVEEQRQGRSSDQNGGERDRGGRQGRGRGEGGSSRRGGSSSGSAGGGQTTFTPTDKRAFSMDEFQSMADFLTVSEDEVLRGLVNVNTAPPEVLACLPGMDDETAAAILDHRLENTFGDIADLLGVAGVSESKFKELCNLITAKSDVFSVRSFGVLGGADEAAGIVYCGVAAVIDRTAEKMAIHSWCELR